MKHKKILAIMLSISLLGTTLPCNSIRAGAAKNTAEKETEVKLKKIELNQTFRVIKKGGKVKLKATFKPKKAKAQLVWKSSNIKVATVSQSGVVKGKKKGKAKITAKANGKKATCKIQVGVPVKKIQVKKKTISLKAGQSTSAGASVKPKNASVKKITYSTSNKKVATVTKGGVIRGVAAGTAKIKLTSADGNKKKNTIVVKVSGNSSNADPTASSQAGTPNSSPDPQASDSGSTDDPDSTPDASDTPPDGGATPTPAPDQIFYASEDESFEDAFYDEDLRELHFDTDEDITVTVPEGDYSYVTVYVDAPNAEIVVEGKIGKLYIENKSSVENYYPTVRTYKKLSVENSAPFRFITMCGGELSDVLSTTSSICPDIIGMGRIQQKVADTKKERSVIALTAGEELNQGFLYVSGGIFNAISGVAVPDAEILLMPYSGKYHAETALTDAQLTQIRQSDGTISATTDENGFYESSLILQGNYFVAVSADGYEPTAGVMCISSLYNDAYVAGAIRLVPQAAVNNSGTIKGSVNLDTTKEAAEGVVVTLRKGNDNVDGTVVASTVTDAKGSYQFADTPYGNYTVSVSSEDMTGEYVTSWDNASLAAGEQTVDLYVSKKLKNAQMRFVASWSGKLENANLHMTGPGLSGTEYHVWKEDDAIYEGGTLSMKSDAKTEAVPQVETMSLYNPAEGEYAVTLCAVGENNSANALSVSGMQVKVYQRDVLAAVYNVPQEEGNVWNVVTYDTYYETYSCSNTLEEEESEEEYFGDFNISHRKALVSLLSGCQQYRTLLTGQYALLEEKIVHLQELLDTLLDEEKYDDAYGEELTWFESLQEEFSVNISGEYVEETSFGWDTNDITVYTNKQGVALMDLDVDFGDAVWEEKPAESHQGALTAFQVTLDSGQSRLFQLYVKTLLEYITPIGAKVRDHTTSFCLNDIYHVDYDAIFLYEVFGTADLSNNQIDINFGETGAESIVYETDEAGNMYVVVTANGEQKRWMIISVVMPAITSSNTIYHVDYVDDYQMTVYWKSLPTSHTSYTLTFPAGYSLEGDFTEKPTGEEDESRVSVTFKKNGDEESAKEIEIVHIAADSRWIPEEVYIMDGNKERIDGTWEEGSKIIKFALDAEPEDWTQLNIKALFSDERITYRVEDYDRKAPGQSAKLYVTFDGSVRKYEEMYYLKIGN